MGLSSGVFGLVVPLNRRLYVSSCSVVVDSPVVMVEGKEEKRITRLLEHATAKRTVAGSQIRGIHAMALWAKDEPDLAAEFRVNAADLDGAWTIFKVEND